VKPSGYSHVKRGVGTTLCGIILAWYMTNQACKRCCSVYQWMTITKLYTWPSDLIHKRSNGIRHIAVWMDGKAKLTNVFLSVYGSEICVPFNSSITQNI